MKLATLNGPDINGGGRGACQAIEESRAVYIGSVHVPEPQCALYLQEDLVDEPQIIIQPAKPKTDHPCGSNVTACNRYSKQRNSGDCLLIDSPNIDLLRCLLHARTEYKSSK